jgi:hypothetical protein
MHLPAVLGNILTLEEKALQRPACNECNMSWYRDFSMFFHGLRSFPVMLEYVSGAGNIIK